MNNNYDFTDCTLVAEGWYSDQPSIVAHWMLCHNVQHKDVTTEELERLSKGFEAFPEDGELWHATVEDLYSHTFEYDGGECYFWFHEGDGSVWAVPVEHDPEPED